MTELMLGPEEFTPIPYIERCDYNDFLAELVKRHGETYLQRPDGALLDGVVFIPQPRPKRQKPKRQAPTLPASYTGNPLNDYQPQMRGIVVIEERIHTDGSKSMVQNTSVKAQVLAALAQGPKTLSEIVKATGLTHGQIKNALHRCNGTLLAPATNKATNNTWKLLEGTEQKPAKRQVRTARERIEAHIAQHGPTTTSQLAEALGLKRDLVYATCHAAKRTFQKKPANGRDVFWELINGKQAAHTQESL